jgi:hypothetical protein
MDYPRKTVSVPYVDPRSKRKNTPEWMVSVRTGDFMKQHRFESREDAEAFSAEHRVDPS